MYKRILRSLVSVGVSQLIPLLPYMAEAIPAPYNLLAIPILQGIGKGFRSAYPESKINNWIPF